MNGYNQNNENNNEINMTNQNNPQNNQNHQNNQVNFNDTNNMNFLSQDKYYKTIKQNEKNETYHSRSNSTNRPFKLTNKLLNIKPPNIIRLEDKIKYMTHSEIHKKDKLSKLINISDTKVKETKYDFVISFKDNPLPKFRPKEEYPNNINKYIDKEREKDIINKSSFDFPSIISNHNNNSKHSLNKTGITEIMFGYCDAETFNTNNNNNKYNFISSEIRLRDKIKTNVEKTLASSVDINNNMKILDEKFNELQSFQESEMYKNKMGVENIVKEEDDNDDIDDETCSSDIVKNLYDKIKNKHLIQSKKYNAINNDQKLQGEKRSSVVMVGTDNREYLSRFDSINWKNNVKCYETYLDYSHPSRVVNQKLNTKNLIEDVRYLNELNDHNKAEFLRTNFYDKNKNKQKKRMRRSVFDLV